MDHRDDEEKEGGKDEAAESEETERASSDPPPPKSEAKPSAESRSKTSRSAKAARREARAAVRADRPRSSAAPPPRKVPAQAIMVAIVALAAGAAVGWFGHDARAKAKLRSESAPAAAGSAGPCGQWEQKICADTGGERSAACQQAKAASELLTPGTCETALTVMPATLEKVKAGRATCDGLVTKLCNDLPKESPACQMVQERAVSFPSDRCKGMLAQYDEVLAQLKMIDSQGPQMMGRPPGAPPGANPHGGPPGGPPGGGMPRGGPPGSMPPQGAPHP